MPLSVEKSALMRNLLLAGLLAGPAWAQDPLERDRSWPEIVAQGHSLVIGRFEGQFDGPLFRSRKIRLQPAGTDKVLYLPVGEGLGDFVVQLPAGVYTITGMESNYVPLMRPMNLRNYRPLKQKFGVRSQRGLGPSFRVPPDRPVYIGTLRADTSTDGIVYQGHTLRVIDEYRATRERLERQFPRLMASLEASDIQPSRHFVLRPSASDEPELEFVAYEDPISRSRDYISEGKFQAAVNWLSTFMPSSDAERAQARLLMGEALLADGRHDEAIERLGEALEAEPENRRALRLLARAHARAEHYDDAVSLYQELARAVPHDAEANLQLGYLFALRADSARSAEAFTSAFKNDQDYLLHDVLPFVVALKAVKEKPGAYEPPRMIRQENPPPRSLSSRRGSEQGGMALIIDHTGKVVAAQVAGNTSGPEPMLLMSIIRAIFKPAALNGVPVPSLLTFGGSEGKAAQE